MKPPRSQRSRTAPASARGPPPQGPHSSSGRTTSRDRLSEYQDKVTGVSRLDREQTIPALALRAFHLPGTTNGWCDDWLQYFRNNHPVLGICCHHPLHPVRVGMRLVILVGSVAFGLAVTNIIWLWFHRHPNDETYFVVSFGRGAGAGAASSSSFGNETAISQNGTASGLAVDGATGSDFVVTKAMVVLWTVGGGLHALFDNTVWFLTACVCCLPGQPLGHLERFRKYGSYLTIVAVVLCTAASTLVVVFRAAAARSSSAVTSGSGASSSSEAAFDPTGGLLDDASLDLNVARDPSAYDFLIGYAVELALALVVYNPLVGTVLFSGILGCGRIPILGGRPYELDAERRRMASGGGEEDTAMAARVPPSDVTRSGGSPRDVASPV